MQLHAIAFENMFLFFVGRVTYTHVNLIFTKFLRKSLLVGTVCLRRRNFLKLFNAIEVGNSFKNSTDNFLFRTKV